MLQVKLKSLPNENARFFKLTDDTVAIVDYPLPDFLFGYFWRSVIWHYRRYAISTKRLDGTRCRVAMHRLIAGTPSGEVCHHYNRNSMDNRLGNLLNMTNRHHAELHGIRKWGHEKKVKTREKRQ